jgi:hypothetical protein
MPEEKQGFWRRLFSTNKRSAREEKVMGYILHRLDEGGNLHDIVEEEYVRRNASAQEVEEILQRSELVEGARGHMEQDFSSGELDPRRRQQ